jgi:hypothetical protein
MGLTINFELKTKFKKILGKFYQKIYLKRFKKTVNKNLKRKIYKMTADGERWTVNGDGR